MGMRNNNRLGSAQAAGTSVYGGGRVASQITGGVDLADNNGQLSAYTLNNGFALVQQVLFLPLILSSSCRFRYIR